MFMRKAAAKQQGFPADVYEGIVQHGLAKHGQQRSRVGRPSCNLASVEKILRYDGVNHWPTKIGGNHRCAACGGRTCYGCSKCDKALHPDYFTGYHVG